MSKSVTRMPSATSLVARSYPDKIIGVNNQLPWHLGTDMRNFRKMTENHAVIMGRKTFESIGKPLKNRKNIVLSRSNFENSDDVTWVKDKETALFFADLYSIYNQKKQIFIIGGEKIYNYFFDIINHVCITDVYTGFMNGDAKFEFDFDIREWRFVSERDFPKTDIDDYPFRMTLVSRKKPFHRFKSKMQFMRKEIEFDKIWVEYQSIVENNKLNTDTAECQFELF